MSIICLYNLTFIFRYSNIDVYKTSFHLVRFYLCVIKKPEGQISSRVFYVKYLNKKGDTNEIRKNSKGYRYSK